MGLRILQNFFDSTELLHERGGGLLPNARDARVVIGGIARERLEIRDVLRWKSKSFNHRVPIVPPRIRHSTAEQHDLHPIAHKLQQILVPSQHDHLRS